MQEPIDSSGELMKDRRYGTGLREQSDRRIKSNLRVLEGFLANIEKQGLVTSTDAKAIVRNVREILRGN